ncbi:MAG: glycosyltransferase [bacterium]|nr:glycosyltransferase [bacterium]
MSRLADWLYLFRRGRNLPARIGDQVRTLHGIAEQMTTLRTRIDRVEQEVRDVGAGVARTIHGIDLANFEKASAAQLAEVAAGTTALAQALGALRTELAQARIQLGAELDATAAALRDEAREQALVLEGEIRAPARRAAEAALLATLPPVEARVPGVSVLVPCWQHAPLLPAAVASARAALDRLPVPGEIVISDDASRDASRARARALAAEDARVRVLESDVNLGLARARNVQLAQARFRHALLLDADNTLEPDGVATLYASAVATGAVLTYGPSTVADEHGRPRTVYGGEPAAPALLWANWIDTMSIVDVDALLALGGLDAEAHGLQDWELALRLVALRRPIAFVPTVVGHYRASPLSMIADAPGTRRHRRLQRLYGIDGPLPDAALSAAVHHPALGWLSAAPGWNGAPAPAPPAPAAVTVRRPRLLVVASGGVRNHGDDAILRATLERLARLRPGCVPVVVTDGDAVPALGRLGVWAGTTAELCYGLDPEAIRAGAPADVAATLIARTGAVGRPIDPALADLRGFDAVLLAGGGNLAAPWLYLVAWRAAIAAAARGSGVPVVVSGQGLGPLSEEMLPLLAVVTASAAAFGVRDPGSAALLAAHGLGGDHVTVAGDDALGLQVDVAGARAPARRRDSPATAPSSASRPASPTTSAAAATCSRGWRPPSTASPRRAARRWWASR